MGREKAQSIVEYTLVLGVIIGIVAWIMYAQNFGIKARTSQVYNRTSSALGEALNETEGKGIFNFSSGGGGHGARGYEQDETPY